MIELTESFKASKNPVQTGCPVFWRIDCGMNQSAIPNIQTRSILEGDAKKVTHKPFMDTQKWTHKRCITPMGTQDLTHLCADQTGMPLSLI